MVEHMTTGRSMPNSLAAVLWDMDGTLVDSEKVWTVSLRDTAHELGGTLSAAARMSIIGSDMPRTLAVLFDDLGLVPDPVLMAEAEQLLSRRTRELFEDGLEWRPGAQDALRTVREAGWPAALVTNTGRALTELALDGIGREHFLVTVCGDEVPQGKPAPDPYLRAADLLGVSAEWCLAVEDSPTGAQAAERAGCAVLVVPCDAPVPPGPDRIHRDSLLGMTKDDVQDVYAQVQRTRAA
jgi:HAD superfamily hydrolase (TIGR01509 family)